MFGDHHHHHAHTADSPLTSYLEYGGEQGWLRETQASFDILRSSFESLQSNETKECAGTCVEVDERQKTTSLPALAPRKSIILLISFNQPHHIALPESQFPCPQTKVLAESSPSASKKSKMASSGSSSNKKAEKVLKTTDILTVTCIAIIVVSDTTNHMFIVRSYRQEKALRDPLLHPTYKGLPNVVAQEVWNFNAEILMKISTNSDLKSAKPGFTEQAKETSHMWAQLSEQCCTYLKMASYKFALEPDFDAIAYFEQQREEHNSLLREQGIAFGSTRLNLVV
ncbi:hypothetical protein B0H10DRAFT_1959700 [Mycena sp. CBHHK59/15]|nr:hypothetical protein B0H10DRAFT_1959700 [Mycena sp. CBHHK59/15]